MKLQPKIQKPCDERRAIKRLVIAHPPSDPELDSEQVGQRAERLSGVLQGILNRHDSPEHISLGK